MARGNRISSKNVPLKFGSVLEMSLDEIRSNASDPVQTLLTYTSSDGRRIFQDAIPVPPPSPVKRQRRELASYATDTAHAPLDIDEDRWIIDGGDLMEPPSLSEKAQAIKNKRYASSDDPLKEWFSMRSEYLSFLVRTEAPEAASTSVCERCVKPIPGRDPYRCTECFSGLCLCATCCVTAHAENPLHRIERWNGKFFEAASLKDAGLTVRFGHRPEEPPCTSPVTITDFVVLHTNGIHNVCVSFCACGKTMIDRLHRHQLLSRSWFPATFDQPHTCATFQLLDHFIMQTLQGKTTPYDYYAALQKMSDNSGLIKLPMRYKEFLRMKREYSHLKALKRAGRAHDPSGVDGTANGELVVKCPACPDEDVNLPSDWSLSSAKSFLYTLYLALDACFRLKRRMVSSASKDPGLGTDWGYFVEGEPFRKYLLSVTDQKEMSTCSGLAALDYANSKFSRGYASTGVCIAVCARHEFVQPNGAADLQVGERYANMDYCFASAMRHHSKTLPLLVSYDIACQWSKSVVERVGRLPQLVRLRLVTPLLRFAVPKLHIHSHTRSCQESYSLNYLPGVGRTDGEGVERPWANIGAVATSTRVMGPGARVETLNDHWSHWNWQKVVGLGHLLSKRLGKAVTEREIQRASFEALSLKQGERAKQWRSEVLAFEADGTLPNPYVVKKNGLTEGEVRLQFVRKEVDSAKSEASPSQCGTRTSFITQGIELMDQQDRIKQLVRDGKAGTAVQNTNVAELRAKLVKLMPPFRTLQATYLPSAITLLAHRVVPEGEQPEDVPILLPSSLPSADGTTPCDTQLLTIERHLREARCHAALDKLRNLLFIKSRLCTYKSRNVRHQGANTRARALIERNGVKIKTQAAKYQTSQAALIRLGVDPKQFPQLQDGDIRCMESPDVTDQRQVRLMKSTERGRKDFLANGEDGAVVVPQEGYRVVSWIWNDTNDASMDEVLRSEWAKSWARFRRWSEEVVLLKEEMRRTLVSLRHQARQWEGRSNCSHEENPGARAGLVAYAHSQAQLRFALAARFESLWLSQDPVRVDEDLDELAKACKEVSQEEEGDDDDE